MSTCDSNSFNSAMFDSTKNSYIDKEGDEMFKHGIYYMNNNENQFDIPKALFWLTKAAEKKQVQAIKLLTNLYAGGNAFAIPFVDLSEYKDVHLYAKFAKMGADEGIPYCVFCMGNIYAHGDDSYEKNIRTAIEYWSKVIELDAEQVKAIEKEAINNRTSTYRAIVDSYRNIGSAYYNGDGIEEDMQKAIYYWERAALLGSRVATQNLITLYEDGEEIPKNETKAKEWLHVLETNSTLIDL